MHQAISPEQKNAITLRYLATGEAFNSLMDEFLVYRVTIDTFVTEVCEAIYHYLKNEYLSRFPQLLKNGRA